MPYVRSIHPSTMGKLLREHFTGEIPISIKTVSEQKTLISKIKTGLKKIPTVRLSDYYFPHDKDREECTLRFSLEDDLPRYYRPYCSLTLTFSEDDHCLVIEYSPHHALVYQVEQIYSFIDKLKVEFDKKKAQAHKTEKINSLKQQAIIARIREIAKEDKFEFATTTWREYQNKLKVMVRLEGGILLEVDIPYNGFQEALKNLRPLIHNVNELQKLGISFKIKSDSGYSGHGWITPDDDS